MKKLVIIILCILLMTGCSVKKVKELTDGEKFAAEYGISENNPFIYATYDDIDNIFKTEGIIFLATPDYVGSQKSAELLNEVAKENGVETIYYYNPKKIWKNKSTKYKKLVKYLDEYLQKTDDNEYKIDLPIVLSVLNGKIIGYSNYLSKESQLSEEKLTNKKLKIIKNEYIKIINYQECSNCD